MAMLTIFKGDDTGGIFGRQLNFTITTGTGVDLTGCRAEFTFDGITKAFDSITSGATIEITFTHAETSAMELGVRYGSFRVYDANGKVRTFDNTVPVRVTDSVAAAYPGSDSASISIGSGIAWSQVSGKPDLSNVANLDPDTSSLGDVMRAVNRLLGVFRACAALALVSLPVMADEVEAKYVALKDLPGKTLIMTNVAEYVATHGGTGTAGTDGQAVTNIVNGIVNERTSAYVPKSPTSSFAINLFDEDAESYLNFKINAAEGAIVTFDANYDDGAALFSGEAVFDSLATFKMYTDASDLRVPIPGHRGTLAVTPAQSSIYSTGIKFTPNYSYSNLAADYFLSFPQRTGVIATESWVTNTVQTAISQAVPTCVNLNDAALNRTWELTASNGAFTFTLIEE